MERDADRVLEAARAGGLLTPGTPVLVLLSGGRDSVCLLDVAARLLGPDQVSALHVNYGLREEADEDEVHCAELCRRHGVELTVERARRPDGAGNLQAWARDVRYAAATRLALERGALVAAGHTATDQVETVLYRLAASPGRRALLGMRPRDGRLIRPLLSVTREDTAAYCARRGLAWREDASNDSDAYARNRARAGLVPALRELHPAAEANVLRTVELLGEEAAVLDTVVAEVLAGEAAIDVARLAALPPALRRLVCSRLAEDAAGRPVPAAARRADELLDLGSGGGSAALDLGDGVRALVEYGRLRMVAAADPEAPAAVRLPVPGSVRFGSQEVAAAAVWGSPTAGEGVLDAGALAAELVVRTWEPGDRMAPLGLGGTATLQDLFTDRRVPRSRRHEVPVVVSDGEIVWVPGVATGERFRVTSATERAVQLSVRPAP